MVAGLLLLRGLLSLSDFAGAFHVLYCISHGMAWRYRLRRLMPQGLGGLGPMGHLA